MGVCGLGVGGTGRHRVSLESLRPYVGHIVTPSVMFAALLKTSVSRPL